MQTGKRRKKLTASVGVTKLQVECDEYGAVFVAGAEADGGEETAAISVAIADRDALWELEGRADDGTEVPLYVRREEGDHEYVVYVRGEAVRVELETERDRRLKALSKSASGGRSASQSVRAPMPGLLKSVLVAEGAVVRKGEALCILEAMKMENEIKSPGDFIVRRAPAEAGNAVEKGTILFELTVPPGEE